MFGTGSILTSFLRRMFKSCHRLLSTWLTLIVLLVWKNVVAIREVNIKRKKKSPHAISLALSFGV
jgi:hypothetical protein